MSAAHSSRHSLGIALSVAVLGLCTTPGIARAGSIIPDQSNTAFVPRLFQSIQSFSPMGQEFTPTFSCLDVVELFTEAGPELYVNIRSGTITGSIVGRSQVVSHPNPAGVTEFDFPSLVPLVPGNLFVIEVVALRINSLVGSDGTQTYSGGDEILRGVPQNNDLWFVEGLVPEPSSFVLLGLGVLGLVGYGCGGQQHVAERLKEQHGAAS